MRLAEHLRVEPWHDLLIDDERREFRNPDATGVSSLVLNYRDRAIGKHYFGNALSAEGRVFIVTTMAGDLFNTIDDIFSESLHYRTDLKVLTWVPESVQEITAFARNLAEGGDKIEQTQRAIESWTRLAKRHSNVKVHGYRSSPTFQGVLVDERWAIVELLPFGVPFEKRPALILRKNEPAERDGFKLFSKAFHDMFNSASQYDPKKVPAWFLDR